MAAAGPLPQLEPPGAEAPQVCSDWVQASR